MKRWTCFCSAACLVHREANTDTTTTTPICKCRVLFSHSCIIQLYLKVTKSFGGWDRRSSCVSHVLQSISKMHEGQSKNKAGFKVLDRLTFWRQKGFGWQVPAGWKKNTQITDVCVQTWTFHLSLTHSVFFLEGHINPLSLSRLTLNVKHCQNHSRRDVVDTRDQMMAEIIIKRWTERWQQHEWSKIPVRILFMVKVDPSDTSSSPSPTLSADES